MVSSSSVAHSMCVRERERERERERTLHYKSTESSAHFVGVRFFERGKCSAVYVCVCVCVSV